MKRTLLSTTALAIFAGGGGVTAAAAEILITGHAEMGFANSSSEESSVASFTFAPPYPPGVTAATAMTIVETSESSDDSIRFHTDIDVTFEMSGETDGGLTFSAAVDLDENEAFDPDTHGGVAITVSGPSGNFALGDTDGAFDWALTEADVGSSLRDDHTSHLGFNGNDGLDGEHDGQILRYDITFDNLSFALSAEIDERDDDLEGIGESTIYGAGAKYALGSAIEFGIGYQSGGGVAISQGNSVVAGFIMESTVIGASARYGTGGGLSAVLNYSQQTYDDTAVASQQLTAASGSHFGLGVGYVSGPLTVAANWGSYDQEFTLGQTEVTEKAGGFGLSVVYDLGGGAELQLGYASGDRELAQVFPDVSVTEVTGPDGPQTTDHTEKQWSLGLAFNF